MKYQLKEIKLELTNKCYLNCIHCSTNSTDKSNLFLNYEKCNDILNDAINLGVKKVAFSGGEPLIWSKIEDLINKLNNNNIFTSIYTTGNIENFDTIIKNCKIAGLNKIVFSLYGGKNVHETITQSKGSFKKTIDSIKYCLDLKLEVEIHFVPLSINYMEITNLINESIKIGIKRISILRFVPHGRGAINKNLSLTDKQNRELQKLIKENKNGIDLRLGSPYGFLHLGSKKCDSGVDRLIITPNLNIYPCDAFKQISPIEIGIKDEYSNLKKHSLKTCWEKSVFLKKVRKTVLGLKHKQCTKCSANKHCNTGCLAQKVIASKRIKNFPDPMCLIYHLQ